MQFLTPFLSELPGKFETDLATSFSRPVSAVYLPIVSGHSGGNQSYFLRQILSPTPWVIVSGVADQLFDFPAYIHAETAVVFSKNI